MRNDAELLRRKREDVLIDQRSCNKKRTIIKFAKRKKLESFLAMFSINWRANTVCLPWSESDEVALISVILKAVQATGSRFAEEGRREECQATDKSAQKIPEKPMLESTARITGNPLCTGARTCN